MRLEGLRLGMSLCAVATWTFAVGPCSLLCASDLPVMAASGTVRIPHDFGGKRSPDWSGGALIQIDDGGPVTTIQGFDKQGQMVVNLTFSVPDSRMTQISGYARASDGSLALSGTAYSGNSQVAAFLAWISPDGKRVRIVRTSPFYPYRTAFAADGTIWTAGWEIVDGVEVNPDHNMVRRFDRDGNLLGAFIPKSSVTTYGKHKHPAYLSYLLSSSDRIGWLSPTARQYIEFSPDGHITSRFQTSEVSGNMKLRGAGLCDDGGLYLSTVSMGKPPRNWQLLTLDRVSGKWAPVALDSPDGRQPHTLPIYACDGSSLVTTLTGHSAELTWLSPKISR